jgi:hypothetical protein
MLTLTSNRTRVTRGVLQRDGPLDDNPPVLAVPGTDHADRAGGPGPAAGCKKRVEIGPAPA